MLYDINKSYSENVKDGPRFSGDLPKRCWPTCDQWVDFLGYRVASRLGVPAGPLLTAQWTTLAARLGFDIVTYKTIRSHAYAGHPLPNVVYVNGSEQLREDGGSVTRDPSAPRDLAQIAITNSFGMPSQSPEFLHRDIRRANEELSPGQVLVVSVVGTPGYRENFVDDFVATAAIAKDSGARIVEANFSCPNVKTGEGSVYTNPTTVFEIASRLVKELKDVPLIIKVGIFTDQSQIRDVLCAAARAGVRAISGINTISKKVVDGHGHPALGADRPTSGVCGAPIRSMALEFVQMARTVIDIERLSLTLIGVGGITVPQHFDQFFTAGADFAQTATGMMWNPHLASQYHAQEGLHATSRAGIKAL